MRDAYRHRASTQISAQLFSSIQEQCQPTAFTTGHPPATGFLPLEFVPVIALAPGPFGVVLDARGERSLDTGRGAVLAF